MRIAAVVGDGGERVEEAHGKGGMGAGRCQHAPKGSKFGDRHTEYCTTLASSAAAEAAGGAVRQSFTSLRPVQAWPPRAVAPLAA
jgi:hypothetical protein